MTTFVVVVVGAIVVVEMEGVGDEGTEEEVIETIVVEDVGTVEVELDAVVVLEVLGIDVIGNIVEVPSALVFLAVTSEVDMVDMLGIVVVFRRGIFGLTVLGSCDDEVDCIMTVIL